MTKLNNKKIKYIINQVTKKNQNTKTMAEIYGITRRRVQQLVKEYRKTGEVPKLKKNRRPRTYLTKEEKEIIDKVWNETKRGARLLYHELRMRGYKIPHNKIHAYLKQTEEQDQIQENRRKGRDADTKGNIREACSMETGIERQRTILTL